MTMRDAFKTALAGVTSSKMRSALTMLGIVIGIASVMLLMSIGTSAQQLIIDEVQGIGSNLVFVVPGATKGSRFASPASTQGIVIKTLVKADADALAADPAITRVSPEVRGQARVTFENNDIAVSYQGATPDFFVMRNFKTTMGAAFTESDVAALARVAVIGSATAQELFGNRNPIGKTIRIKQISFRVVGVLEPKGIGPFGVDQDNIIIVPISVAQKQLLGIDHFNSITIEASEAYDVAFTQSRMTHILRRNHRITDPDKDDFTIRTQADALEMLGSITGVLTAFLTSIACISLVVGGIGIMNIMLVSVAERTKEIGLRKALGATNKDILLQFLLEAMMLTILGGIIGMALGVSLSFIISLVLQKFVEPGWAFAFPTGAIMIATLVSALTGIVFGLYPARQAARKSPVEALRYE